MHAEYNVKFSNVQQAKSAYNYRNTKEKLYL
jgi:HKD family nuclease